MSTATDKKALLSNFASLALLQGSGFLLPLMTLPYLVRVLGVANYGLVNFAAAVTMYFNIFVSFGFDLSATRNISMCRDDSAKVSEIYSAVLVVKMILTLLSFVVFVFMVASVAKFHDNALLFYLSFGSVIGNVIFPTWLFQGLERMKYITYLNLSTRVLFTALVFIFVHADSDYLYVPLFNSLGTIVGGVITFFLIRRFFGVRFVVPKPEALKHHLLDSYRFFLSRIANDGSRYYSTTLIGLSFGNSIVGYYSMVEKLYYAFMSLGGIASQTIYPYMARTRNIRFFRKLFYLIAAVSIFLLAFILLFHSTILQLAFKQDSSVLCNIFMIMFTGSIFGIVSSLIGYPLLAAFGHIKCANNSLIAAAILYMLYITLVTLFLKNIYLTAFALVVYELFGALFRVACVSRLRLWRADLCKQ